MPGTEWALALKIKLKNGASLEDKGSFDFSNREWQSASVSLSVSRWAEIERVDITGQLQGFRGAVLWDQFVLVPQNARA
jgi:hypothetical protein